MTGTESTLRAGRPDVSAAPSANGDGGAGAALSAATVCMGLIAGLFYAFAIAVMLGLRRSDDRTFITAMQRINESIQNIAFAPGFFGSLIFTAAAAVLQRRLGGREATKWILAGLGLYVATLAVTMAGNIPLNEQLAKAGDVDRIVDLHAVRARFENRWVAFNVLRTLLCTAALGCLTRALLLHGRAQSAFDALAPQAAAPRA